MKLPTGKSIKFLSLLFMILSLFLLLLRKVLSRQSIQMLLCSVDPNTVRAGQLLISTKELGGNLMLFGVGKQKLMFFGKI